MRFFKLLVISFLTLLNNIVLAQQWALYNTKTQFDVFENSSQKSFQPDSSRQYAFNFFIPTGGATFTNNGPAEFTFRKLIYGLPFDARNIDYTHKRLNHVTVSQNTYIAMLRIFKSIQYNREVGFSWQIQTEANYKITNETFAILHNYDYLDPAYTNNIFNDKGKSQIYHQFSLSYRENYNRRLAFGAKLSYLSGIAYSKLNIDKSSIDIDKAANSYNASLKGYYRTNVLLDNPDYGNAVPNIKNPGAAITLSANYKNRSGWYMLGNLKDIGFIYWTKKPYTYHVDQTIQINNASANSAATGFKKEIEKNGLKFPTSEKFTSLINGKAQILLNRDYDFYQPNLIISKNLFNDGGQAALVNTYKWKLLNASITTAYDFHHMFQVGGQLMLKSPNAEFYAGSDQLFKTYSAINGIMQNDETSGSGYNGMSAYLGFALKFGSKLERRSTTSTIPGFESRDRQSLFKRMFKIRRSKTKK